MTTDSTTSEAAPAYPPPRHVLRYLRLSQRLEASGDVVASIPILPDLRDATGGLRFGALATLVDSAAGIFSVHRVLPDWVATLDMKIHVSRATVGDTLHSVTRPLRVGGRNVVSETTLHDAEGEVGLAFVTYARLPARGGRQAVQKVPPGSVRQFDYAEADEEPRRPLDEYLGLQFLPGDPVIELDHITQIHNSFGSIQGGVVAMLLERVAALAAERTLGVPAVTTDLHLHYLAQAKGGPFRVSAEVIRVDDASVTSRVQIVDAGHDDRLLDVGTATASAIR